MEYQNIYDNKEFFKSYQSLRNNDDNANELIEKPTIKKMLPNIEGKRVLDLGCGVGEMSNFFIESKAKSVLGIDISQNMIDIAKQLENSKLNFQVLPMEEISSLNQKFDMIFSSLAFHYINDFDKLICDISNLLTENGILIFSQEHPLVTATVNKINKKYIEENNKRYYLLSDYNINGKREIFWNVDGVIKYHRNFSTIINTLAKYNFQILDIQESQPLENAVQKKPKYRYQQDRPYFLFVKAIKK